MSKNNHTIIVDDNIYLNAVVNYDSVTDPSLHTPIPFVFNATYSQSIIEKPKDFYLSVIRFSLPGQQIPIFFNVGYNHGVAPPGPANVNKTFRSITMTFGANTSQQFLIFVPNDLTAPVPSFPIDRYNIQYYAILSYQQFIDQINAAFALAYAAIGLPVLVPALAIPYMVYDPNTQLFTLYVDERFVGLGVGIYMNTNLYNGFLPSFNTKLLGFDQPNGMDYQFIINNNHNNSITIGGINYLFFTQEFKTLSNLTQFRSIVLTIANVPIRYEILPQNSINPDQSTQTNFLPILTDFIPSLNNSAGEIQTNLVYYPTAEYRLADLIGNTPINKIEIKAFWADKYQNLYPLYISAHESASIKLLFRNRKLYNQIPDQK